MLTFHDWLLVKGYVWPNLGVNWPAGDSWGAAGYLSIIRIEYEKERNDFNENQRLTPRP